MKKNKMKKGFTMAELLISLTILGVIAAILIPIIVQSAPNKNALRFKKAYLTTETVVYELINSNDYPDIDQGFSYYAGSGYPGSITKFCNLVGNSLAIIGDISCHSFNKPLSGSTNTKPNFITSDGTEWYIAGNGSNYIITVDVNGADTPNTLIGTSKQRDRFLIFVSKLGKVSIPTSTTTPTLEQTYLMMSDDEL